MKISVITPRFALSGVPLAQLRLARALAESGHNVDLLVGCENDGHKIPAVSGVNVRLLGKEQVRHMLVPLMRHLHRERPQIVFTAEDHLNAVTLVAAILTHSKAKISCSSRVTPFDTYSNRIGTKRWWLKQLMRLVMHRADALTCVSKDMVTQYRQVFPNANHVEAYNIVEDAQATARMAEEVDEPWLKDRSRQILVGAGALAPWKGFDDLVRAMSLVANKSNARLLILGDGPDREKLQDQIDSAGLTGRVKLTGFVENPLAYFSRADVFVLSSRVEGMPNVLVEAMMCGCTPVATDCPTGPRELLHDGRCGTLVPVGDVPALADAVLAALANPKPRRLLREAVAPFRAKAVIARHMALLRVHQAQDALSAPAIESATEVPVDAR